MNSIKFQDTNTQLVFEKLVEMNPDNLGSTIGMEFIEVGKDLMIAKIPVDARTIQPFGLLHGGASVVLAETLCSIGAFLNVDTDNEMTVGLEINANHLKPARSGYVTGKATPIHIGKKTQVWETRILDDSGRLISISRCTLAVVRRSSK